MQYARWSWLSLRRLALIFFCLFAYFVENKHTRTHPPSLTLARTFAGATMYLGWGRTTQKKLIVRWLLIGETQSNPRAGLSIKHVVSLVLIANFSQSRGGF